MKTTGYLAAALLPLLALLLGCGKLTEADQETLSRRVAERVHKSATTSSDDDPIVIAGGSLHVFTPLGWEFRGGSGANDPMTLWDSLGDSPVTGRYINYVDAMKPDGTALGSARYTTADTVTVIFQYCEGNNCNSGHIRNITFNFDGSSLTLDDDVEHKSAFNEPIKNYLKHYSKKDYKINQISTKKNGTADQSWTCPSPYDCDARIHLHIK